MPSSPLLARLAWQFWERAGPPPVPPYPIADAIRWSLPLYLDYIPKLDLDSVVVWFKRRRLSLPPLPGPNRPLRGCVAAREGQGVLLVDALDSPAEQRFTIAHETAHFILECEEPRRRARLALGESALQTLDGRRLPAPGERLEAALAGVELDTTACFLDRSGGAPPDAAARRAESQADQLALELLAPAALVLAEAPPAGLGFAAQIEATAALLENRFGLPPAIARRHASRLRWRTQQGPSIAEWLGI